MIRRWLWSDSFIERFLAGLIILLPITLAIDLAWQWLT